MKKRLGFLLAAALVIASSGCRNGGSGLSPTDPGPRIIGSGKFVTEVRNVSGFDALSFSGAATLTIAQTGVDSLAITAEDNILPLLMSDVSGGRLVLGLQSGLNVSTGNVVYELTVRSLNEVDISGPARVDFTQINIPRLDVGLSGPALMTGMGTVGEQDIRLSGPSVYRAGELSSSVVQINATGPSFARVRVSQRLDGRVDLPARVEYLGNPAVTVTGTGVVSRVGN